MDLNNVEFTWIKNKPENWKTQRVKNHFILTKNRTETPQGYPILSLTMKGIIERDVSSNEGQLPETYNGYNLLEKDDIVFNPMDLISGWVDCSLYEGLISPSYKVLRPISEKVNIRFYTYYFQTHYKEKIFFPFGEGVHYEYRWGLGTETLKNFPIVVPPLSEQHQIVSFLDTKTSLIDSLIEKTQRKIKLLKEKRTSVINQVVTKGLNPNVEMKDSGVEWIGEIPSHWEKSKLKYKGVFFSGYSFDSNDFLSEGEIRVLKISNIQNNGISWDDLQYLPESFYNTHKNFSVNKGDLVFVLTRPIISTGIKVCFFNEEYKTLLNQRNSVFRPNESSVIKRFLFYSVRTFSFIEEFKQQLKETNQPNISTEQISNILMFFPQLDEQQQIVEYLDKQTQLIDNTISIEEKRTELLKEYRQSLISELVTGKRKVV
jgi:type I restriction enzyme, S subunit